MAKQAGINPLIGTIGGVTFYKKRNPLTGKSDFFAKQKSKMTKAEMYANPRMARTIENSFEMGLAGEYAKEVFRGIRGLTANALKDASFYNRVRSITFAAREFDTTNNRGERQIPANSMPQLFTGLEINRLSKFDSMIRSNVPQELEPDQLHLIFKPILVRNIFQPQGATHFRLCGTVGALNGEGYWQNSSEPVQILGESWYSFSDGFLNLGLDLYLKSADLVDCPVKFYLSWIEFAQEVNGEIYPFNDKTINAGKVILCTL